jgi:hypothetical protein
VTRAFRGSVTPAFSSSPTPSIIRRTDSRTVRDAGSPRAITSVVGGARPSPPAADSLDTPSPTAVDALTTAGRRADIRPAGNAGNIDDRARIEDTLLRRDGRFLAASDNDPGFAMIDDGPALTNTRRTPVVQFTMICRSNEIRSSCKAPPRFVIRE